MKIRLKFDLGVCEGYIGTRRGDVIEVSDHAGQRYIELGYAEAYGKSTKAAEIPVEKAVAPEHETATVEVPEDKPKPLDEDDDAAAPPKPGSRPTPARRR
jgi:hypothetical protein